jgi:hypothetical protein
MQRFPFLQTVFCIVVTSASAAQEAIQAVFELNIF